MVKPRRIIFTPFRSRNLRILEKTNITIRELAGGVRRNKQLVNARDIKDKIESKPLSRIRPGAIE